MAGPGVLPSGRVVGETGPGTGGFDVTPHDDNDLVDTFGRPQVARGLEAKVPGNARVVWLDGSESTIYLSQAGWKVGRFRRVKATGTTAQGISATY